MMKLISFEPEGFESPSLFHNLTLCEWKSPAARGCGDLHVSSSTLRIESDALPEKQRCGR